MTPASPIQEPFIPREIQAYLDGMAASSEGKLAARRSEDIVAIVGALTDDDDIRKGAALLPFIETGLVKEDAARTRFGEAATRIASELVKVGSLGPGVQSDASLTAAQAEALRKMLLAIVTDPRLVLVKLASQLALLRASKDAPATDRERIARETRDIYAPLANRLGVWQLKWELEDLSFRFLEPENYKQVAGWLASKRADRERYIDEVIQQIATELTRAGIDYEVAGRPKHIFSIWRKMQRKGLSFDQLYDIRAVRVLVNSIADCYATLGLVHSMWPYIPGEFDDYIATPKDNLYRSLHTAVIGPGKLPVEIQIRTREMHEHAELGVAAHWQYKEGARRNPAYDQKIVWLRQILEPTDREGQESSSDFLERVRSEIFEDRVYALSPRGEVIELPKGATPLDFAYHVHTDLGHRCRGAKVNGRMVPLNQVLANGDQVEIITARQPNPSRDWLVPSLGYLVSQRNRSKVRSWFRKLDEDQNRQQGRQILDREMQRLAIHSVTLDQILGELKFDNPESLYLAIGEGDVTAAQISGAILRLARPQELPSPIPRKPTIATKAPEGITIEGVGDLLSHFPRCCGPVPPEPITGYITLGRGVSIHRQNCVALKRLEKSHPERLIAVEWGTGSDRAFPVDINVRAFDRRGLVRDITGVLADSKINIHGMNTLTNDADGIADINLRITVQDLEELSRVLGRVQGLPNVMSARRKG